jgi:hypothetical protein
LAWSCGLSDGWSADIARAVIEHQRGEGELCEYAGSWDPIGAWGAEGGRVFATALMASLLTVPKRYARVFPER